MRNKINIIYGTTASGKTKLGIELAKKLNGVVINCDSMQIYKEIPILSAQPTAAEKDGVEHRLFGYVSLSDKYDVGKWLDDAVAEIKNVLAAKATPILVGGTGLYIKSLVDGIAKMPPISLPTKSKVAALPHLFEELQKLDPPMAAKLKPNDVQRTIRALEIFIETGKSILYWQSQPHQLFFPRQDFYLIQLLKDRAQNYRDIELRFLQMIEAGAIEEVRQVYQTFGDIEYPKAHGIPELISYIKGEVTLEECIPKIQQNSRNYAKRQLTWGRHQLVFDQVQ
ncbi:MAG: tRNA (adenosine(37)-N6)-dimethylallyltransferase MiaA [Rickettsiales bacterium]